MESIVKLLIVTFSFALTACTESNSSHSSNSYTQCIRYNSIWDKNEPIIRELLKAHEVTSLSTEQRQKLRNALNEIRAIKYDYQTNHCTKYDAQKGYFELHKSVNDALVDNPNNDES